MSLTKKRTAAIYNDILYKLTSIPAGKEGKNVGHTAYGAHMQLALALSQKVSWAILYYDEDDGDEEALQDAIKAFDNHITYALKFANK